MDVSGERIRRHGLGILQEKREVKMKERDALSYIVSALWGLVAGMAVLPFSSAPFGFAALAVCSRYILGVVSGAALSCAITNSYEQLAAYAIVMLLRLVQSLKA